MIQKLTAVVVASCVFGACALAVIAQEPTPAAAAPAVLPAPSSGSEAASGVKGDKPAETSLASADAEMTSSEDALADEVTITLPGGVTMVLVKIPPGSFQMGSPYTERGRWGGEDPVHLVTLSKPFYLGKTEVTQAQWQAVMGSNPDSNFPFGVGPTYPVFFVSWNDVAAAGGFVEKLNQYLGTTKYRLPSEAEWEYAARAGTTSRFSFGDNLSCDDSCGDCTLAAQYMWWCANSGVSSQAVKTKAGNPFGLYDMHGNLGELVQDTYHSDYTGAPSDGSAWESGGDSSRRIFRGASWADLAQYCRSAFRGSYWQDIPNSDLGFRLACDAASNPVTPPVIALMKKVSPPFKIVVTGSNLQSGIRVYIDGTQWTSVTWKSMGKVQLTGAIKAAVPKGTTKSFRFVNPDGGETTTTWGW